MIEQQTILDQIEVRRDGTIGIRLALRVLKDGVEISSSWHRTSIMPGQDSDGQMAAVNTDITTRPTLMAMPVGADDIAKIKSICDLIYTPEVVAQFQTAQLAAAKLVAP